MGKFWRFGVAIVLLLSVFAVNVAGAEDAGKVAVAGSNYKTAKNTMYAWSGYPGPCAVPTSAVVLLEKQGPLEVMLGESFTYMIQISNRSTVDMIAVTLDDVLPDGFALESIDPKPDKTEGNKAFWNLGTIPAKAAKLIKITGKANRLGDLISNANARICYEMPLPLATKVIEGDVLLDKQLPAQAELCEVIPMRLTVTSASSIAATNVVICDVLPEGLLTIDGKKDVCINVGTLPAGTSKSFQINLKAKDVGVYENVATVTTDRTKTAVGASASVKVVGAELTLAATGPSRSYINNKVVYDIKVTNNGDAVARDVVLTYGVAGKVQIHSYSNGGKANKNAKIYWALGNIQPGETKTAEVCGVALEAGSVNSTFNVTATCAEPKTTVHAMEVEGVPGVLTTLKDDFDAVPVGQTVNYTVTATNQGSKPSTDLRYTITLDDGMEFVSGNGASAVTANGKTVTFAPVPSLGRGQTIAWVVTVKATSEGDKRFTAELMTGELDKPVAKSESTTFYSPEITTTVAQ